MGYKRHTQDTYDKVYAQHLMGVSIRNIAANLDMSAATVQSIIRRMESKEQDKCNEIKSNLKDKFEDDTSDIINRGLSLLKGRLEIAQKHQDAVFKLIKMIYDDDDLSTAEKKQQVAQLNDMLLLKTSDITSMVTQLYDKRALARGEATENTTVDIRLPPEALKYAE